MKAFKEWINNPDIKFWLDDYIEEERSEFVWRAALEWALTQSKIDDDAFEYIDTSYIEEELEYE